MASASAFALVIAFTMCSTVTSMCRLVHDGFAINDFAKLLKAVRDVLVEMMQGLRMLRVGLGIDFSKHCRSCELVAYIDERRPSLVRFFRHNTTPIQSAGNPLLYCRRKQPACRPFNVWKLQEITKERLALGSGEWNQIVCGRIEIDAVKKARTVGLLCSPDAHTRMGWISLVSPCARERRTPDQSYF